MENETIQLVSLPNKYSLSIKEKILYGVFKIVAPIVGAVANVVGGNSVAARSYLAIGLLGYANNYTSQNIDLLSKQAVLETANFVSPMAINDGNIFGMHRAYVRPHYATGFRFNATENADVFVFPDEFCSVMDRILWDRYNSIETQSAEYVNQVIADGYNPFDDYKVQWESTTFKLPWMVYALAVVPFALLVALLFKIISKK